MLSLLWSFLGLTATGLGCKYLKMFHLSTKSLLLFWLTWYLTSVRSIWRLLMTLGLSVIQAAFPNWDFWKGCCPCFGLKTPALRFSIDGQRWRLLEDSDPETHVRFLIRSNQSRHGSWLGHGWTVKSVFEVVHAPERGSPHWPQRETSSNI